MSEPWRGPHHSDDRISYEATVARQGARIVAGPRHYCPGCGLDLPCANTEPEGCWACVSGRGFDICPACMLIAVGQR